MPAISHSEIVAHDADTLLPPDGEFEGEYWSMVEAGRDAAATKRVAFVAICRNAMPFLPLTMKRLEKTAAMFGGSRVFIYENDSVDGTKDFLDETSAGSDGWLTVSMQDHGRPHLNYTKEACRTIPLAEYRNACRAWVAENCSDFDYTVVFDTDPWGGWSVDGVANTVGWLALPEYEAAAGMGSYSWAVWGPPITPAPMAVHYDGFACRWTWWKERQDMGWFHMWHPPVGSRPVLMNSCFGQLALYRTKNFLAGEYRGGDCEHIHHWRTAGGNCYLNPSMRCVAFWIPKEESE